MSRTLSSCSASRSRDEDLHLHQVEFLNPHRARYFHYRRMKLERLHLGAARDGLADHLRPRLASGARCRSDPRYRGGRGSVAARSRCARAGDISTLSPSSTEIAQWIGEAESAIGCGYAHRRCVDAPMNLTMRILSQWIPGRRAGIVSISQTLTYTSHIISSNFMTAKLWRRVINSYYVVLWIAWRTLQVVFRGQLIISEPTET